MQNMEKFSATEVANDNAVTALYAYAGCWMTDSKHSNALEEIFPAIHSSGNNNSARACSVMSLEKAMKFSRENLENKRMRIFRATVSEKGRLRRRRRGCGRGRVLPRRPYRHP